MTLNYKKLGFKSGLEIHQQLDTGKLFSNAPSYLRSDEPDYVIKRKLHAVPGETGKVDVAVAYEASLDKEYRYEGYDDTISLVELDEEPPRPINEGALDVVLQVALLLNCQVYGVSQVMRKTVIDGSNTSGFQRTVLIAHDGFVETSFGKVPVESVALEEDSARRIRADGNSVTFRLDRLGIPLIEITTEPSMSDPEQVKECALKIGEILRSCRVKRGIGTIRQDVNVSVKGHDRVEIKGFQDPKMFIKTIDLEIERQLEDIKNQKTEGGVRKALVSGESEFLRPLPGKARMYPETDLELLRIDKKRIDKLKRSLPRLKADIQSELKKKGLSDELIRLVLADHEYLDDFNDLLRIYPGDALLVAKMVTLWRQELATKLKKDIIEVNDKINFDVLERLLKEVDKGNLSKNQIRGVFGDIMDGVSIDDAVKRTGEKIDDNEIEEEVRKIIKEKPGLRANAYMGLVMKKLGNKIDAKKAMEIIKRIVGAT